MLPIDRPATRAQARLAELLRRWAGLALPRHRWAVLRPVLERLSPAGTVEGGLERLEAGDRSARQALLAEATVPETYLFRHPAHFEALDAHARAAAEEGRESYRVLSAGCATGEEAWSAAAVLDAVGLRTGLRWTVTGWELDAGRLARARAGQFSAWSARRGLHGYDQAFEARGSGWAVQRRLRGAVDFECVNLKVGPTAPTALFDAVFLRNVAIYWVPEFTRAMIDRLATLVAPGGLLLLGASEPEQLDRHEWSVEWRGHVRVAVRRPPRALHRAPRAARLARPALGGSVPVSPRPTVTASLRRPAPPGPRVASLRRPAPPGPRVASLRRPASSVSRVAAVEDSAIERVRERADRGCYREALALLDALPPAPEAERYLWRGLLYLNLSRLDEALSSLRKAVFLDPVDEACRHWLAVALIACGHHEAAAREQRNLEAIHG